MDIDVLLPFHRIDSFFICSLESLSLSEKVKLNVILIDDTPNQNSDLSFLKNYLNDYLIIKTGGKKGYGKALELGSQFINSDILALFNSDDLVSKNRFYIQSQSLEECELSITQLKKINQSGKSIYSLTGELKTLNYDPIFLLLGSYGANASWVMRKDWWFANSFFDDKECLDWRIALKSFSTTKISYISEPLYYYRKHSNQVTQNYAFGINDLDPVYLLWRELCIEYGIKTSTIDLFGIIAAPWVAINEVNFKEFILLAEEIVSASLLLPLDVQKKIKELIKRRFALAILNNTKLKDKLRLMVKCDVTLFSLLFESSYNFARK